MSVRIPLPKIKHRQDATAHPYPFQVGIQTLEFLQVSVFHASFTDIATGEFVRMPEGLARVEEIFTAKLQSKETYDELWEYFERYLPVFEKAPYQHVLIALTSQWDWYVRKIGEFICFAGPNPSMPAKSKGDLARIDRLPILRQIEVLEEAAGIQIELSATEKLELNEMTLVRNLGLHNRWEVDGQYLAKTGRHGFQDGELRIIDLAELNRWHDLLTRLVSDSSKKAAVAYAKAPSFP
jgi:hypothetical protein